MLGKNLCITVLTGRRLGLLRRTLESLDRADPSILRDSVVVAYLNGRDTESYGYLSQLGYIDRLEYRDTPKPEPIGNAVSRLANWVPTNCRYVMHMEDDWTCQASSSQFLGDASLILEHDARIGQVRMRLKSEPTLGYHMITQRKQSWVAAEAHGLKYQVSGLHFTFNPTLVRVTDLPKFYPADHELTACRRYLRHYPLVAQLVPGVFKHIGDEGRSLRAKLGRA